ncbi:SAV_2336 N-terminal domain-related protein [Kitasatospora sp. NPDC093679]|uniref:SAV_2336 N-terminal domain-related protein n=1 Tax=Kitasatospora sp. NPDC093679 TaxID=3154983 RepID=UPI0034158958
MNGRPGPDRLGEALAAAGIDATARELAEVLWLAERIGPPAARPAVSDVPPPPPSRLPPPGPDGEQPPAPPPSGSDVYAAAGTVAAGVAATPVLVRSARALPGQRRIVRALRPLRRTVPSLRDEEPDEQATADLVAETGRPDLALRPRRERWLDLTLVVDDGLSMELWTDLAGELRALFAGAGLFRRMRCHGLDTRHPDGPRLKPRPFGSSTALAAPRSGLPADGRGMVLVLSDTVGTAWRDGRMDPLLSAWARSCPTAVLQPLPQRLWPGTGLPTSARRLQADRPGGPNTGWRATDPLLPLDLAPPGGVPVPVLELGPAHLAAWTALVAGGTAVLRVAEAGAPRVAAPPGPHPEAAGPAPDMAARLALFRAAASPEAFLLAGHLAAVSPLTLPVMRLVQRAVLRGRAAPAQLAEVMLGGLLRRSPVEGVDEAGGPRRYDFRAGVRELLLDSLPARAALDTAALVGEVMHHQEPQGRYAPALLADTAGTRGLPPGAVAFAGAGAPLLARFAPAADGGPVADLPFGALAGHDPQLAADVAAGRWSEAVARGEEVLERLLAAHGPGRPEVLAGRFDLAEWIGEAGAPHNARRLLRQLHADLDGRLGPDHPRMLRLRAAIAEWTGRSGEWTQAADGYRELLTDQERLLGRDHPDCLHSRARIGFWLAHGGSWDAAVDVFADLLPRQLRVRGADHRETLRTRANLASLTGRSGGTDTALRLWQELLPAVRRTFGPDDQLTLATEAEIGHWTGVAGDPAAALRMISAVLPRLTAAFGPAHETPYEFRRRLAQWTGESGDAEGAVELLGELLGELGRWLIPEHPTFLNCRGDHAYWTARLGDREEGLGRLRELLPELESVLGHDDPYTRWARNAVLELEDDG